MFTFTHLQRRTTAFGLLLLFAGALLMAGACAIWCGPNHRAGLVATIAPRTGAAPHSCCAAKAAKATKPAASPSSEKPECCQHEKAAKWAAVPDAPFAKLLKAASPEAVALLPEGPLAWPAQFGGWAVLAPVRLVPSHHLPPKIPDRRVFLRSLIV